MIENGEVAIFWDYENCEIPSTSDGFTVASGICRIAHQYGTIKVFNAYLEMNESSQKCLSDLPLCGVSVINCPHNGRKDVADKTILVDMWAFAMDTPAPATIVLISGDRDFAYAVSKLRQRRYNVIVIAPNAVHTSLKFQASRLYDWFRDVLQQPVRWTASGELKPKTFAGAIGSSAPRSSQPSAIPLSPPSPIVTRRRGSESANGGPTTINGQDHRPVVVPLKPQVSEFIPKHSFAVPEINELDSSQDAHDDVGMSRPPTELPSNSSRPDSLRSFDPSSVMDARAGSDRADWQSQRIPPPGLPAPPYLRDDEPSDTPTVSNSGLATSDADALAAKTPPPSFPYYPYTGTTTLVDTVATAGSTMVRETEVSTTVNIPDGIVIPTVIMYNAQKPPSKFRPLVRVLEEQRLMGNTRVVSSVLGSLLSQLPSGTQEIYRKASVSRLKDYTALAERENVVILGAYDPQGNGWIALHPAYHGRRGAPPLPPPPPILSF